MVIADEVAEAKPQNPIAAVIALVVRENRILLVRRANPPDAGRWGFPGGKVEFGEPLLDATERELLEETAVRAKAIRVITAVDAFDGEQGETPRQHFVLIGVLCRWQSGEPKAGDDALDADWFTLDGLERGTLATSLDVPEVAALAFREASRETG